MAFESNGMGDKLGNRYEGRWVARQLLKLLKEEIKSVTVELIGPDEYGVDLLVEKNDGIRQLQQCKARLASRECWSVAKLKEKGILDSLKYHLSRDPQCEFALISSIPARNFSDICDSARISNDNPKDFLQYQIHDIGKERSDIFNNFCQYLTLDPKKDEDLENAFNYLKRTYVELFPDDYHTWDDLLTWTSFILSGNPENVLNVLLSYAENEERYRKPIYSEELWQDLSKRHGIHPRPLEYDYRITPAVNELQKQFSESIQQGLIGGMVIPRKETSDILESIDKGQDVVVHGSAGNGKSGILYELTEYLQERNIPYLPVRLDRRLPNKNAKKFGMDIGLPESPAFSLAGLTAGRKGVLILDQLDAIRWTAAHSAASLYVCKEIIRQVRSLRHPGNNIVIVIACRTFDMENDPDIKNFLSHTKNQDFIKIPVEEFSKEQLNEVIGSDSRVLTGAQKSILSNAQNLAIWMQLRQNGMKPDFRSATELMSHFWENQRKVLENNAGLSPDQINDFLKPLLDYMESKGEVSAPGRIANSKPTIRDALISYGIIQEDGRRISFCHQRYLDYLIAERLLRCIDEGVGSIFDWLGRKENQSLFRREQLRQILVLLSDESPSDFFNTSRQLLESSEIRFHLKHLVLELIGQLQEITEDIGKYCLTLFGYSYWQNHILETVFLGHPSWIRYLLDIEVISEWLSSSDKLEVNRGLWLLRSVAEHIPDKVTDILTPFVGEGEEWFARILNTICLNETHDSEQMFELRLCLARNGYVKDFVKWESLCTMYPLRAIRLIEAVVSTWQIDDEDTSRNRKGRLESWFGDDLDALRSAVTKDPSETWDLLMPHVDRLTYLEKNDSRLEKWQDEPIYRHEKNITRGIVELLICSGQCLAVNYSDKLIERTTHLEKSISPIVQEIIVSSYYYLPTHYADIAIGWLVADSSRFRLGSGYNEPEWMPAYRLIKSLSPYCSEELFRKLENVIIHYHAPEEKELAEICLKGWRDGVFRHYWGMTQYFLLPALNEQRIRSDTLNMIRVLERRFKHCTKERFLKNGVSSGGWVGSKLDPNLEKISDRAWLQIVSNKKVRKHGDFTKIQVDSNRLLEASIHQFAGSLSRIAKRFPERFAQLALRFPDNVHPSYVSAILECLMKKQSGEEVPNSEKSTWQPVQISTIEAVLDKYQSSDDRETAISFCRLIAERADEIWSERIIARLVHYACNHPDLENDKLNINCDKNCDEATIDILFQNTINCVRGLAARAIGELLWENNDWLDQVSDGIDSLVHDPHPAIRMAAIDAIFPVLNINKTMAVRWFCEASKNDLRIPASPHAIRFFNYIVPSHINQVEKIIQQMAFSSDDKVSKEGSKQVSARYILHDLFEKEFKKCCNGTIQQRKGVASALAELVKDRRYSIKCQVILPQFMNDTDKEVRDELSSIFNNKDIFNDKQFRELIKTYVKSKAFIDSADFFIWNLSKFNGDITLVAETIFAVCENLSTTLKEKTRNIPSTYPLIASEVSSLLLRLYEQAINMENKSVVYRCLDIWDMLFENRVGRTIELTKTIEQ